MIRDAIGNFNKNYVKTEIFSRDIGRKIGEAEEIRHASDYDDFYIAIREILNNVHFHTFRQFLPGSSNSNLIWREQGKEDDPAQTETPAEGEPSNHFAIFND